MVNIRPEKRARGQVMITQLLDKNGSGVEPVKVPTWVDVWRSTAR